MKVPNLEQMIKEEEERLSSDKLRSLVALMHSLLAYQEQVVLAYTSLYDLCKMCCKNKTNAIDLYDWIHSSYIYAYDNESDEFGDFMLVKNLKTIVSIMISNEMASNESP